MNRHGEKERLRLTSVPILCRIILQNAPYMDYKLLVLMSFEVTTVTSNSNSFNVQIVRYGSRESGILGARCPGCAHKNRRDSCQKKTEDPGASA